LAEPIGCLTSTPWVTTTQLMVAGLVAEGCVRLIEAR
jgi:hypothetical protein